MNDPLTKSRPRSSVNLSLRRFISRFQDGGPATAPSTASSSQQAQEAQEAPQVTQGDTPVQSEGAPQAEIIEKDVASLTKMYQIHI